MYGASSASAMSYGRINVRDARWQNGQVAFSSIDPSATSTYDARSLTGYLFMVKDGSYHYMGTDFGRFVNYASGFKVPSGTYVLCISKNGIDYGGGALPQLYLGTNGWYKSKGVAPMMESATRFTVTANTVTYLDDVVLPVQEGGTALYGYLRGLTRYRESIETRLVDEQGRSTGFEIIRYADAKTGRYSVRDIPQGRYMVRYGISSSRRPTRTAPVTVFAYRTRTGRYTVTAGMNNRMPNFTLPKLPRKQKRATGGAYYYQAKLREDRWLVKQIPYSQVRWFEGYRTDCSGFASQVWGLGISNTTYYWPKAARRIKIHDARMGDVLILYRPSSGRAYHAYFFHRWIDEDRGIMEITHQTSAEKAVTKRVVRMVHDDDYFLRAYRPRYASKIAHYAK